MKTETRDKLMTVSTATLCTALFKRGLRNQFIQDVRPLNPNLPNMVGEAFTLRYIPAREDLNPITVFQDRNHPQRVAVEQCPPGAVMVFDSRKDARAASAGGILVTRLMVRGAGRRRHRRRLSRLARDREDALPGLPPPPQRAHQPDAAPGAWTSTCPSAAATWPCGRATWWWATRRRDRDPRRTWPTKWPTRRWR
jgi:hypothetical protein